MIAFRDYVRRGMELQNISQAELARRVGVTRAYVSFLLAGKGHPSMSAILRFTNFFGDDRVLAEGLWEECRGAVAVFRYEEKMIKPDLSEEQVRAQFCADLVQHGYEVETEFNTPFGRIDILARKNGQPHIIEVKTTTMMRNISSALGQLLFYSTAIPDVMCWVHTPQVPDQSVRRVMAMHGVGYAGTIYDIELF